MCSTGKAVVELRVSYDADFRAADNMFRSMFHDHMAKYDCGSFAEEFSAKYKALEAAVGE